MGNGPQLSAGIGWQRRLALDSSLLAARAARVGLDLASPLQSISNRRRAFTDHYRELAHLKTYFPLDPIDPGGHESLGKIQRDLIRLNAAILRKQGCTGLVAWRSNSPWDPLDAYSEPASGRPPRSIDLAMMNGERRAAAVNLSNAADSEATVSLNIDGFAAATRNPDWIDVFAVRGTDTQQNVLQSDLLAPLLRSPAGYTVRIPAGMTQQLWLRLAPSSLPPGKKAAGTLHIAAGGVSEDVPVRLAISGHRFPSQLTLSFGDPWIGVIDVLLFGRGAGSITPYNVRTVNGLLKDYRVDVSGGAQNALTPGGDAFGSANFSGDTFTPPANFFQYVDRWMAGGPASSLPATSLYVLSISDRSDIGGVDWHTDPARFAARLRSFAQVWEDHLRRRGIDPRKVAFMYSDEPDAPEAQRNLIAWGTALQRGRSGGGSHVRLTMNASPDPAAAVHLPFLGAAAPAATCTPSRTFPAPVGMRRSTATP